MRTIVLRRTNRRSRNERVKRAPENPRNFELTERGAAGIGGPRLAVPADLRVKTLLPGGKPQKREKFCETAIIWGTGVFFVDKPPFCVMITMNTVQNSKTSRDSKKRKTK